MGLFTSPRVNEPYYKGGRAVGRVLSSRHDMLTGTTEMEVVLDDGMTVKFNETDEDRAASEAQAQYERKWGRMSSLGGLGPSPISTVFKDALLELHGQDYEYGFNDGQFFMRKKGDQKMEQQRTTVKMGADQFTGKVSDVQINTGFHGSEATVRMTDVVHTELLLETLEVPAPVMVQKMEHEVFWGQQSVLKTFKLEEAEVRHERLVRAAGGLLKLGVVAPTVSLKSGVVTVAK